MLGLRYAPPLTSALAAIMNNKPSIFKIVNDGIVLTYNNRIVLLQALIFPAFALLLIDFAKTIESLNNTRWFLAILGIFINTTFAITVNRIVLLGSSSVSKWGLYKWTKRETYFFIHLILLALFCGLFYLTAFIHPASGMVIGALGSILLLVRFSLIFPATAIDKGLTFVTSWSLSKNHKLLMLYIVIIVPILFALPNFIAYQITDAFWVTSIINIIATIFTISFLSLAYNEICDYEYSS